MQVSEPLKTVLITGANGFIGSNLRVHLSGLLYKREF
jgi:nucleoside-diphosphate-sugar epimerase